jgi:phosphate:Na+ symporter
MDWVLIVSQLIGGLTLFMYGMQRMNKALKSLAGDQLKDLITAFSKTQLHGFLSGIIVSGILQSSTVVTVMLVSLVSTNVMTFSQSLGILLGTGIGSTFISQIVALKLTKYCLIILSLGYVFQFMLSQWPLRSFRVFSHMPQLIPFLPQQRQVKLMGLFLFGMGLLFFGMELMSDSVLPLRTYPPFLHLLTTIQAPLLGLLVSVVFTLLIQSSSASISVVIALAGQDLISIREAVIFVFGANIGTCGTALIAALGKHPAALRVALAHVFIKVIATLPFIPLLDWFVSLVLAVSPDDKSPEALARQIANAHTLFNVIAAVMFLPFIEAFARWMTRIVPDPPKDTLLPILLNSSSEAAGLPNLPPTSTVTPPQSESASSSS